MVHPAAAGQAVRTQDKQRQSPFLASWLSMQRFVPRKSAGFSSAISAGNFFPQIPQIEFTQMSADASSRKVTKAGGPVSAEYNPIVDTRVSSAKHGVL
jgi:hypothetical protein